ncbi:hypothetical protein AAFF_G00032810 [Aldrovandia affinis]|uniref:Uncharacterized protein n=1 Tax=Aldrovandia affinis TaxID=143900 RepID=A0AAD7R288_9TELE|nr:hypothetical protein AAFF_G00032810 [Aldrovandia affinis]
MSNVRQKRETTGVGRKTSLLSDQALPTTDDANVASSTLDAPLLQSMIDSLKSDIFVKIDALSASLRSEISSVRQELKSSIEPLQRTVDAHEETVRDLERAATDHSTRIDELESTVSMLTSQVKRLDDKCEDLEGRSRRNNIRVLGVPEGLEGHRATDFVAQLLQDLLGLNEKPLLDRAHRILERSPRRGPPRPFVKRAAFGAVKRTLRSYPNVKFGLLFPATLRITMPDGRHTGLKILLRPLILSIRTVSRLPALRCGTGACPSV